MGKIKREVKNIHIKFNVSMNDKGECVIEEEETKFKYKSYMDVLIKKIKRWTK